MEEDEALEEEEGFSAAVEDEEEAGAITFSEDEETWLDVPIVFLHPARSIDRTARDIIPAFVFFIIFPLSENMFSIIRAKKVVKRVSFIVNGSQEMLFLRMKTRTSNFRRKEKVRKKL